LSNDLTPKQSLAELCNTWITEKVKGKFDYSSATARQQDISNFMKANKDKLQPQQQSLKIVRDSYMPQLKRVYDKFGLDLKTIGLGTKKKLKYHAGMNSEITPDPQAGKPDTSKKPNEKVIQTGIIDPNTGQPMVVPETFDEKAVSAVFSALFLTLRMGIPQMELLTPEEKETLGKMWKPAFNMYFSNEKWAVIGIPLMATMGIALPKMLEGRKQGKILKSKTEGNLKQLEVDSKVENQQKIIQEQKVIQTTPTETTPDVIPNIGEISGVITPNPNKETPALPKKEPKQN